MRQAHAICQKIYLPPRLADPFGSKLDQMRRVWATLLTLLFSLSLIIPAVSAADAESSLPACCRRNGTHHCSLSKGGTESSSGPAVQPTRCSLYPSAKGLPTGRTAAVAKASERIFAGLVAHPATRRQTEARYRISFSRTRQKRGPPSLS
jgi:hypothetical protein